MIHLRRHAALATLCLATFSAASDAPIRTPDETLTAVPPIERFTFGHMPDGRAIDGFTLRTPRGASAKVIAFGAILAELRMPDRTGRVDPVIRTTVFSPQGLERGFAGAAAVHGRFANRIRNARFTLDGREYRLTPNQGPHNLHSGPVGFDQVLWHAEPVTNGPNPAVRLSYSSPDGDQGFPGNLAVTVTYTLTADQAVRIEYSATTDNPTPVNLTNHAFFNLSGSGSVARHELFVNAEKYTVLDADQIPTGEIRSVDGTPLDFRRPRPLGARALELGHRGRYNHPLIINRLEDPRLLLAARLHDPRSGRVLEVWTTEPGLQLFTNDLRPDARTAANGFVCLETQHFPDSVNHPHFPDTILRPGEVFRSVTEYRFSAR